MQRLLENADWWEETALFRLVNTICWEPDLFMKCKEASVWYTVLLRRCPLAVWAGISDLLAPHCLVSLSLFLIMEVLHHGRDIKRRLKKKRSHHFNLSSILIVVHPFQDFNRAFWVISKCPVTLILCISPISLMTTGRSPLFGGFK